MDESTDFNLRWIYLEEDKTLLINQQQHTDSVKAYQCVKRKKVILWQRFQIYNA